MTTSTIKVWLLAVLLCVAHGAMAQSQLPPCPQDKMVVWSDCYGELTFYNGNYVGEFKDNRYNGQGIYRRAFPQYEKYIGQFEGDRKHGRGIEYREDGSVARAGVWNRGVFVRAESIETTSVAAAASEHPQIQELSRLRAEAQTAIQRQRELEEQLKLTQAQPTALAQAAPRSVGKRVALVIGNAAYKVRPLRNPRNDADDVSRSLKGSGFEVIDLRDASLTQMRSAIRQFGDKLLASDTGLVYYSGHGIEIRGRNYFIPVNADIQREDEVSDQSLDVALILEKMGTAQKAVNILIVDACRDDPFGRSFRSSSKGLASMEAPRGTIVAYATSPGKVAADGDGRNSPYTKHLVRAMQAPNKPIELVFKEVRRAVQDETKNLQTPWENTSLSGDFYFRVQK